MRRIYLILLILLFQYISSAKIGDTYKLPEPEKEGGMPLYEALNNRRSQRDFDKTKPLDAQIISQALWSCYGVNRPNNYKTTPSAVAWFPLIIYVFIEDGVYKYNPEENSLTLVLEGDYRATTGTQDYPADAGADFVVIADFKKKSAMDGDDEHKYRSIYLDTGHCTMGLYLVAASNGLKGVDRAMVDSDKLLELLGLPSEDYKFTLAFSLGY